MLLVSLWARHNGTPLSVNGHACLVLSIHQHNSSTAGYDRAFLCFILKSSGDEDAHAHTHKHTHTHIHTHTHTHTHSLVLLSLSSQLSLSHQTKPLEKANFQGTSKSSIIQASLKYLPCVLNVCLTFPALLSPEIFYFIDGFSY